MSYTVKEFLKAMENEEFRNLGAARCSQCNKILDALDRQEPHELNKKTVCSDCYFEEWGKIIETPHNVNPGIFTVTANFNLEPFQKKSKSKKRKRKVLRKKPVKKIKKLDFIFKENK
jgi:hypothetical protein